MFANIIILLQIIYVLIIVSYYCAPPPEPSTVPYNSVEHPILCIMDTPDATSFI
jgi:hypothetical protein